MATETPRSQILSVDDSGDWAEEIELVLNELSSQLAHPIFITVARTKSRAYAVIEQDGDKIFAVIADRRLSGSEGVDGENVAEFAMQRGIPNVAILTGDGSNVRHIEGVDVLDKAMPQVKLRAYLERVLGNSGLLQE